MNTDATLGGQAAALAVLVAAILIGTVVLIRTLRRDSYRSWPLPFRAAFLLLVAALCVLGAICWLGAWSEVWGWPATIWLVAAPFIYGLLNYWQQGARSRR